MNPIRSEPPTSDTKTSRAMGSMTNNNGFWIGWLDLLTLLLQSLLFTSNYSTTANLHTSQIIRTGYPFPGNGFITGTITSNHYDIILPFLVQSLWNADLPELNPNLQFCLYSDLGSADSVLLLNSPIPSLQSLLAISRLSIYRRGTAHTAHLSYHCLARIT
jgi:hypothetical protein